VSLKLVRVDDRLIHGQVVAVWLNAVGANEIVIVDDRTAQDAFLRDVLMLAASSGTPSRCSGSRVPTAVRPVASIWAEPMAGHVRSPSR